MAAGLQGISIARTLRRKGAELYWADDWMGDHGTRGLRRRSAMIRRVLVLMLLAGLAPGWGCSVNPSGRWTFWPWAKVSDRVPGITPPPERMRAIRQLGERAARQDPIEQNRLAGQLAEMYAQEPDPLIRGQIIQSAGYLAGPNTLVLLRSGLKDRDADVRVLACESLGRLGGPEAAAALAEALGSDTDPDVRLAAVKALGQTSEPSAIPLLGMALDERDPAMQYQAVASLRKIAPVDYGNDVERWRSYVRGEPVPPEPPLALVERIRRAL